MADHDRTAAPRGQETGQGLASGPIEIIGRLVQQQEVRFGEDQGREPDPRDLTAGQTRQLRIGRQIEAEARQRGRQPSFERPVDRGEIVDRRVAPLGTAQQLERRPDAEQIGHPRPCGQLRILAQQANAAIDQNASGMRKMLPRDRRKQRRLPDAVAADETGPLGRECQIEVGDKRTAVRRGQRQVRQDDGGRHGNPRGQGGWALRSGSNPWLRISCLRAL